MTKLPKIKAISVFFPAYNEAENIASTVTQAFRLLKKIAHKFEIIVVDDGSSDATAAVVKQLMRSIKRLRLVSHFPNQGYGQAIKTGINEAQYDLICYTDSDGQFQFKQINKFIKKINQGYDMVIGYRLSRTDNLYRRFMAKILRLVGLLLFGINVKDVDCGFKVFKKQIIETIGPLKTSSAITETELVARTQQAGFKLAEVGVKHHSRAGGVQTGGRPSIIIKAAIQGIKLWLSLIREKAQPSTQKIAT